MIFQITNSRTSIIGADHFILNVLDKELRYPTAITSAKEAGIELPGEDNGWDGWVRQLHIPKTINPWFPTGLVHIAKRLSEKFGYGVSLDDQRVRPEGDIPEIVDIPLRDYQQEAVEAAVAEGRGVLDMPPRSGKTRTMCEIQRQIAVPTVWIAPTDRIVRQTVATLEELLGKNYAYHLVGSAKAGVAKNSRVVVCTAATAGGLPAEFYESRQAIIVDEWHHAAAPSYKRIFQNCEHIYFRFGMTGTFFRSGEDALAMHSLLSKTIYRVTSLDLLRWGYLVPVHAVFIPVPAKRLRGVPSRGFQGGHGTMGIHDHVVRNQLVAHAALMLYQTGRKTVVLCGTKKQGYQLQGILKAMLPAPPDRAQFKAAEFVSTDMDRKKQGQVLASFDAGEEVKVLLGTSILGEGVDLPTADALVLARGEKAEVSLTQAMYRVSTAVPGKDHAVVVDFADRHHRKLQQHSLERLNVYYNEPTFTVQVLNDPREFPIWVNSRLPIFARNAS